MPVLFVLWNSKATRTGEVLCSSVIGTAVRAVPNGFITRARRMKYLGTTWALFSLLKGF
jgi:hypothetical protein